MTNGEKQGEEKKMEKGRRKMRENGKKWNEKTENLRKDGLRNAEG